MKIAVNTRFLIPDQLEGFGHYTHEILSRMVAAHPQDAFQFFFDRPFSNSTLYGPNVQGRALGPKARHPALFYLWYQYRLRNALHSASPDVFFSPDSFMPLKLDCPAVITVHDVAHRPYPQAISYAHRKYYDFFMPKFLNEAAAVITVSHFSKLEILKYYRIAENKIHVIYNGIGSEYKPFSEKEKAETRRSLTNGAPYFLFVGAIHPRKNVARLIHAYSIFRTLSAENIKLVIAGRKSWDFQDVEDALRRSPFRDDIHITGYIPASMLAKITASAHALCYVSLYEGFGLPVAEAMACEVPVIVTQASAQAEVAGDAGIEVDAMIPENIAEAMLRLTTDSLLRQQRIEMGRQRAGLFSWDSAARDTYALLQEVSVHKKR